VRSLYKVIPLRSFINLNEIAVLLSWPNMIKLIGTDEIMSKINHDFKYLIAISLRSVIIYPFSNSIIVMKLI
jgi:hypothetical protein